MSSVKTKIGGRAAAGIPYRGAGVSGVTDVQAAIDSIAGGGGGGGSFSTIVDLLLGTADPTVPNGRIPTDSAWIHWDFSVANEAVASIIAGSITATQLANGAVGTTQLAANAVTYAKLQQASADTLLGNPTGSTAAVEEITLDASLKFSSTTLALNLGNSNNWTAQQYFGSQALTDASSVAWDVNAAQNAKLTIAGNRTLAAPSNLKDGGLYTLLITQGSGGSHTLAYNSVFKWPGGTAPVLSTAAGAIDMLCFRSDGTNLYGVANLAFA